ncbi:uncharacterized protein PHALS_07208 [Plasmopara halstedii]|uniref:Uncharacterized protein n=1 Tax=Plasmopara halstedii TaxID=4781 RepID=A0A0P1B5Y4_PLAHL|nr:uncharacterized protein PHALS_07208 [Plasmopara halstedii]CEG49444.1 hypothetical protein PHALS_07208 [Plasmopara halstedii]|eukprot:XP_024585813.1 hypothetical protein PHALS_07208 [Plasmopara halstedii]
MRLASLRLRQSARIASYRRPSASPAASSTTNLYATYPFVCQASINAAPTHYVKSDTTGIVAGVAVVGALIGVGKMIWSASSSSSSETKLPAIQDISQAEIALFFTELLTGVDDLFKELPKIESALRNYLKDNNHEVSDAEFQQAILSQLYQMMEGLEQQVVEKRKWSHKSLEIALDKYAQDAEILKLQEDLNALMRTVFPSPVEVPDDLTADKTLAILKEMVAGMEKAMADMLAHARAEGITDVEKAMEEFQSLYLEHVESMTQAQMKAHGISQQVFATALQKYHTEDEQFRKQVEQIYTQQAEAFRKMGVPVDTQ